MIILCFIKNFIQTQTVYPNSLIYGLHPVNIPAVDGRHIEMFMVFLTVPRHSHHRIPFYRPPFFYYIAFVPSGNSCL